MLGDLDDVEFDRQRRHLYVRSVHAATAAAFKRAAGEPPEMAYVALALELRERGIEPDPDAVYSAARLISRGERPAILRPQAGTGRRMRRDVTGI